MRRILIFSLTYYPRSIGGAEVAVKEITDRISPTGIEFDMITLGGHGPDVEKIGNVTVYRIGNAPQGATLPALMKVLYAPFAAGKAVMLHRQKPYDVAWPIMASYAGFAALIFTKLFSSVRMFLTIQEGDNFDRRDGVFNALFRLIFKNATRIQSISNFLAEWSRGMGATCPITVIPNGVDVSVFSTKISEQEAKELKEKLGKKEGDVFLVTTSRLVQKNGVADVIAALEFLPKNVKFLVIGSGELESELKAQTSRLNLEDRVMFLGYMPHADMAKYVQISDIFIRPSLSEGLGNSFLEAMAAEIPVIATAVGGIPDFLVDGETGLFCEVNSPKSIAQKVEKLMKDRESREYMVKNAKKMVLEKYQWEGIAGKMREWMVK